MFSKIILFSIKIYQRALSFDHSPLRFLRPAGQCKFHPTCSEYAYLAIQKYGVISGVLKSVRRLLRCHPWSIGGYDPIN